ncbi:FtsX-like permease family protein [Sinomonas susongensis]|uniref:FtsX-like permease family protein n=1 Tax=Sinomonas susongensis TaxID=1324851 RepID=UPI001109197E|nr:ABC transporter permease [Sinomonas susongensis]
MLQVAFSQLRTHARRFVAIVLAVLLAVGFLSATLMVNASTTASLVASIGQDYAKADLVVSPPHEGTYLSAADAAAVAQTPGVADSYAEQQLQIQAKIGSTTIGGLARNLPASARLEPVALTSGSWPTAAGQVAVDAKTAAARGLAVGSTVELLASGTGAGPRTLTTTVTGIMAASTDPQQSWAAQFAAPPATLSALSGAQPAYASITVLVAPGSDRAAVASALDAAVHQAPGSVMTPSEKTVATIKSFTGGSDRLTIILLAFAAVALLVAGLVVANTFSVLIAQRTRELALLRCIGASRRQIRASVILEALITGIVASVLGVGVAVGVVAVVVALLAQNPRYQYATLAVPASSILVGLAVGTLLTVLAALFPARAATRVSPLAALRPSEEPTLRRTAGRVRLVVGLALTALGAVGLGIGAAKGNLLLAVPAGAVSFVGIVLAAALFVPRLVAAAGLLAAPAGVPGRMAAVNAVRNPRRTTATASALVIGVTLVTMMMTGAATAQAALGSSLDRHFPVGMAVNGTPGAPFTAQQLASVRALAGVEASAVLTPVGSVQTHSTPRAVYAPVYKISASDAAAVIQSPLDRPAPGGIVLPHGAATTTAAVTPGPGTSGGADPRSASLAVTAGTATDLPALVLPGTLQARPGDLPQQVWLSVDPKLDGAAVATLRTQVAQALGVQESEVSGAAIEKATFTQVINTLLLVVTGLLAVAVLIALIGVANTLSLSVLERTRENSLLRALGLTRGQLRGMLALEAVLVAGVAAVIGTALGILYGWLGAQTALSTFATVTAIIPWAQVVAVVVVAAAAGLGA